MSAVDAAPDALPRDALPRDALPRDALPRDALPRDARAREGAPREAPAQPRVRSGPVAPAGRGPDGGDGPRGRSVRRHLALFAAALLLPILILIAGLLWSFAVTERDRTVAEVQIAARDLAVALDRELLGLQTAFGALASSPLLESGDIAGFRAQALRFKEGYGVNVALRDPAGRQLLNTRLAEGEAPPTEPIAVDGDAEAIASGRPVVSNLFVGSVTGTPLFAVVVPVRREGRVAYLLSSSVPAERAREVLARAGLPEGWTGIFVDRAGTVVARSRAHDAFVGRPATEEFRRLTTGAAGRYEGTNLEGAPVIAAYATSELSGWKVSAGVLRSVALAPLRRPLGQLAGLSAVMIGLGIGLGALFARRLTGPVLALAGAADALALGGRPRLARSGLSEVDRVGGAIEGAAAALARREAALEETNGRLRNALAAADLGPWEREVGGDERLTASPTMRAHFGRAPDEPFTHADIVASLHPEDRGRVVAAVAAATAPGGGVYRAEYRIIRPDGSERRVESRARVVRDAEGRALRLVGVSQDVTARHDAEAALRESEAHHRHTVELNPQVAWTAGPDGALDRVAARWEEWTGTTGLGDTWGLGLHPDDLPPTVAAWKRSVATGEPYDVDHRVRHRDGAFRWCRSRAFPRRDAAGAIVKWYGATEDVDEARRAREALARDATRYEGLTLAQRAAQGAGADLDALLRAVAAGALGAVPGADGAVVEMREGDAVIYRATAGSSAAHQGMRLALAGSLSGQCIAQGRTLVCDDAHDDPRVNAPACERTGARSLLVVPIPHRGEVVGAVKLTSAAPGAFDERDAAAAQLLAGAVVTALSGAAEAEAEAARRASEAFNRSVLDASADCIKVLSLDGALQFMTANGRRVMEVDDFEVLRGCPWPAQWPESMRPEVEAALGEARAGRAGRFTGPCDTARGSPRWWDVVVTPILGEDGAPARLLSVSRDVTERQRAVEALRASETEFRALSEATPALVFVTDASGANTYVNPRYAAYAGVAPAALLGDGWRDLVHPDDRAERDGAGASATGAGGAATRPYRAEFRLRRHDGAYRWFLALAEPLRGADGGVEKWFGTCTDIDEERRAREEERVAREAAEVALGRTQALLDGMSDGWCALDEGWRFLDLNERFAALGGFAREAALGRSIWDVFPRNRRAEVEALHARALAEGRAARLEFHSPAFGRWIELTVAGDAARRELFVRDADERRRAEEALRQREAELARVQRVARVGGTEVDVAGGLLNRRSPEYLAVHGLPPEAAHESHEDWARRLHPEDRERVVASLFQQLEDPGVADYAAEYRVVTPQGRTRWISALAEIERDGAGRPLRLVAAHMDVTARKEAEAHRELLIHELNHRVKNTLAVVQSIAAQSLRGAATLPEASAAFEARLLALARAHDVLTRESWEGADLAEVVAGAAAAHGGDGRIAASGPRLRLNPKQALAAAMALHELATNAAKYGALSVPGGGVSVEWSVEPSAGGPRLRLAWRERGGPEVRPPSRRGFGSRLVERALAAELGGTARLTFAPEGVECLIEAPLPGAPAGPVVGLAS